MREPCPCGKDHVDVEQCDKIQIAHRALALHARVRELEKTRDEMQVRRDEAIEAKREAQYAAVSMATKTPPGAAVEVFKPEPGSVVVLRVAAFTDEDQKTATKYAVMGIQQKHPEWTLILSHPGKEISFEDIGPQKMRARGWIRVEHAARIANLFRAHVEKAQRIFGDMNETAALEAVSRRIHDWQAEASRILCEPPPVRSKAEGGAA